MDRKYQIFISSTYEDLKEARAKVIETILSLYHIPIGMEMFSAADDDQWAIIKDTIDSCDYYVVIIGHRYGSETPEGISYTEKECDYAREKGIPTLAFIRERDIPLPLEKETMTLLRRKSLIISSKKLRLVKCVTYGKIPLI